MNAQLKKTHDMRMGQNACPDVWVVFSGQTDLPWLRILKAGFRHCYVVMSDGRHWFSLDPLSNYTDICVHQLPPEFNMPLWLADRGYKVVPARLERKKSPAPWMVFTCVEAVKRVLGLHKRFIFTPWQLYCHLIKEKGEISWEV